MDQATAEARLRRMLQVTVKPLLDESEIADLLVMAEAADAAGLAPADPGYTPTYTDASLRNAAAEGWRWKAAKASSDFEIGVGTGKTFKRQQVIEHCLTMAAQYGASLNGSAKIGSIAIRGATAP